MQRWLTGLAIGLMATGYLMVALLLIRGIFAGMAWHGYLLWLVLPGFFFLPGAALWQVFSNRQGVFERLAQVGVIAAGLAGFMAMLAALPMLGLEWFIADPIRAVSIFKYWYWWVYLTVNAAMATLAVWPWLWVKTRRGYLVGGYSIIALGWYLPGWLYPAPDLNSPQYDDLRGHMFTIADMRPDIGIFLRTYQVELPETVLDPECPLCGSRIKYMGPFGLPLCTYTYRYSNEIDRPCSS